MKVSYQFVILTQNKHKDQPCTISLRIIYKRKAAHMQTGKMVLQNQFNFKEAKKGSWRVVEKHPRKDQINIELKTLLDNAINLEHQLRIKNKHFTAKDFKNQLTSYGKPAVELFKEVLADDRGIKSNTKEAITSMIVRLTQFAPDTRIENINYQFAKDFEEWLKRQPSRNGGNLVNNTVNKYIRDLSRMLDACIKYEYITVNKLTSYDYIVEPRGSYTPRAHLTIEEIEHLENYDFSQELSGTKLASVNYTVTAFLFSCYTGLRISDIMVINSSNYKDGILTLKTIKGEGAIIALPINKLFWGRPERIFKELSRYRIGVKPLFADRSAITHQANMLLIKRLLYKEKKISFHSARHSFATALREMGVKEFTIQKYLGHKKVETTLNTYDHSTWQNEEKEITNIFKAAN